MISTPEPIVLSYGFETRLTCEMNIRPDKFQWKFYPSNEPYNPKALIDLGNGTFHLIPENTYVNQGRKSSLTVLVSCTQQSVLKLLIVYTKCGHSAHSELQLAAVLGQKQTR